MRIGWYPGHMNKARKDITKALRQVDAVMEILDARLPYSSANPLLDSLIGDKGRLRVLNKADLADPQVTQEWLEFLNAQQQSDALSLDKSQAGLIRSLPQRCFERFGGGKGKRFSMLIVGIPNVGKSTLMNILLNRKLAKTGNEPAVTRQRQEVKLNEQITLIDTPGMLWPKIEDENSGYRLAATGAIKNTAFAFEDVGLWTVAMLAERYPQALVERYGVDSEDLGDASEQAAIPLLTRIGERRGCLVRGAVDFTRASELLLNDLRTGKLGRITLERPDDIPQPTADDSLGLGESGEAATETESTHD